MSFARQREPLLLWALIISILLHLLLGLLLAVMPGFVQKPPDQGPMFVEVVPPRKMPPPRTRELEQPRQPPPVQRREQPAKRLGPDDRVAPRETAPTGEDDEDQQRTARAQRPPARPAAPTPPMPPATATAPPVTGSETPLRPTSPTGEFAPAQPPGSERPRPSLGQLTTLTPTTKARIEKDWRRKYREGVEKGDTVWLDTEQDLLISFFKRFKTNIYNVWNYPERARVLEEQGTCLLRITVSRQGTIDDVQLLEGSGSYDLDQEAIRAVSKGQPYGPLPAAYPNEQLHIMAYFRYSLSKGIKYPGRVFGER